MSPWSNHAEDAVEGELQDVPESSLGELEDGDKDWNTKCSNCGETPTVHPTGLCGPCCFGEADTVGGNW